MPILADAFLKGKDVKEIARSNVIFSMSIINHSGHWLPDGKYMFDGSLLDVMVQLSSRYLTSFEWLLDQCGTVMDSSLLLAAVGFHTNFHGTKRCALKKILSKQVDLNATGHQVTPLQMVVAACDVEGVTEMLEAGADPNAAGSQNGASFKTNSILERFNKLHGLSPLHICRNFMGRICFTYSRERMNRIWEMNSPAIESLLLQHGAREFTSPV